jgi:hypothetical protein
MWTTQTSLNNNSQRLWCRLFDLIASRPDLSIFVFVVVVQ